MGVTPTFESFSPTYFMLGGLKKKYAYILDILKMKIKLVYFKVENDNYFDLKKVLKKIHGIGIHNILVECGKSLTHKMIT